MKLIDDVHPDKIRGGFYTPPEVVKHCLTRISQISRHWPKRWLEPAAGDGAFIRGIGRHVPEFIHSETSVTAIELLESECHKCELSALDTDVETTVINASFFEWLAATESKFDAVVGNPPYVRYQFVGHQDRLLAEQLLKELGIELGGVANLWIPFTILSLNCLCQGGCFSFVLPSELFCTTSGGQFRAYLVRHFTSLHVDLIPRGTFKGILQDVVVISGRKAARTAEGRPAQFKEIMPFESTSWRHRLESSSESWLRYLLNEREFTAFKEAKSLAGFYRLGDIARLEVAIVTGANDFFTVSDAVLDKYRLHPWAVPLLARTSDAPGVVFSETDHSDACERGNRTWLLDFSSDRPSPMLDDRVVDYLAMGRGKGLPQRYKCRIREPWYRVPHIKHGTLMMTKRAHHYHRLVWNEAMVYTTDTIYRGEMRPLYLGRESDLVATFQNTYTLLSTEIEGRTYGGGVLELVPSEVAELAVPLVQTGGLLRSVDRISRKVNGQRDATYAVLQMVDKFLVKTMPEYAELLPLLSSARHRLHGRRHELRVGKS